MLVPITRNRKGTTSRTLDPRNQVLKIVFPDSPSGRAREVISRSNTKQTGKFPSWKLGGRSPHYESPHERTAFILLDACPQVLRYQEQPCHIYYVLHGERHHHVPDILVDFADARDVWEVKTPTDASDPFIRDRTQLLEAEMPRHGFGYRLAASDELSQPNRLQNAELLLKYGHDRIYSDEREQVRRLFCRIRSISWGDARRRCVGPLTREVVARLTLEGGLIYDTRFPITDETQFSWRPVDPDVALSLSSAVRAIR